MWKKICSGYTLLICFSQICENIDEGRGNAKMKKGESAQKTVWAAEKICRQYLMIP